MKELVTRALISLTIILALGSLALSIAFCVYALFFYLVILDGYQLHSVFQKFYTSMLTAVLLIPLELYLHLTRRRSLIQYGWILLLLTVVLDMFVSTIVFYRPESVFFAYIADVTELNRYSLLLLANEMLASLLSILAGLLFLFACQPLPIRLNLIDQRRDSTSNQGR